MRKFTKMVLTLAMLFGVVVGVNSVKAETVTSDFSELATDGATWDFSTKTMSWSAPWSNAIKYFMFKDLVESDGYYDLSLYETITFTFTYTTETTNGVRVRMKDDTGGDGDWILMKGNGEHTLNITEFKKSGAALNYSKIAGIQISGGDGTTAASSATFTEISMYCENLTNKARTNLANLITLAEKQNSFGKTATSFANLTSQISTAKSVKDNGSATIEQLVSAKTDLQAKLDALELLPGYTYLTLDMYKTWEVKDANIVEKGAGPGVIRLNEALTGGSVPYGNTWGSGDWQNFAELSNYSKLYITGTAGEVIRGYFNKSPEGTGTVDKTVSFNAEGVAEFDFTEGDFSTSDYVHLIFLKCPSNNSGITSLLLYDAKKDLRKAVEVANMQIPFAKTDDSFTALTTAKGGANTVINNRTASSEQISEATTNLLSAISGLKLQDGFTNLTTDMYKKWDSATAPTTCTDASGASFYVLNESTAQPYGDGSVKWYHYADISDFTSFTILAPAGTPRVMMNRAEGEPDGGTYVEIKEAPVEGKTTINLTGYDYAHLNAIKETGWGSKVTVTGMYLYRTVDVAEQYATFGSLYKNAKLNGVTAYAAKISGSKVVLTEVTNVPAGKGVIVEAAAAGSYAPTFDVAADDIDTDLLVSNGTVEGDGSTIYVLAKKTEGVGFYKLAAGQKVPAGKAYLTVTSGAPDFIGFEGMNLTGIETVKAEKANNEIFNLAGQRVAKTAKGLYIVNGKKVVVK